MDESVTEPPDELVAEEMQQNEILEQCKRIQLVQEAQAQHHLVACLRKYICKMR